jgi:GNAT superfamily N-acetyltransferase
MKPKTPDHGFEPLAPQLAQPCAAMTFPAYRHMLSLEPTPRHPQDGDPRVVQPTGVVAVRGGEPVGLALAELPVGQQGTPELLSLFVRADARGQGTGTALLAALEEHLGAQGVTRVETVYMTGGAGIPAFERVLWKRRWDAPTARTMTVRFTPESAARASWYGRVRLPAEYEIFPWGDLKDEERAEMQQSNAAEPWVAPGLEAWAHDQRGFDSVSSVGLRYHGKVVGWVINHRIAQDVVRFTCSFMRKDLGRRGRILPLYTSSIERLRDTGCRFCTFITPVMYRGMVDFVKNRCGDAVIFLGETRGAGHDIVASRAS